MVMGVSSYPGKGRRRRQELRKGPAGRKVPSPSPQKPKSGLAFRPFISGLMPFRLRIPKVWSSLTSGLEANPEGVWQERFLVRLLAMMRWFRKWGGLSWRWSKPALSVLILIHLGLIALFPGGVNTLFGVKNGAGPKYLTQFQMVDAFGYERGHDGFLVYKIFSQNGEVVQGVYPDDSVLPRLRQNRWAAAGHAISGPYPRLHRLVLERLLERLPAPPVRLELYSARYRWDRDSLTFPWPGKGPDIELKMNRLGVYTGFSRRWKTASGPEGTLVP